MPTTLPEAPLLTLKLRRLLASELTDNLPLSASSASSTDVSDLPDAPSATLVASSDSENDLDLDSNALPAYQAVVEFAGEEVAIGGCIDLTNFMIPLGVCSYPLYTSLLLCSCGSAECLGLSRMGVYATNECVYWHIPESTMRQGEPIVEVLKSIPHSKLHTLQGMLWVYRFEVNAYKALQHSLWAAHFAHTKLPECQDGLSAQKLLMEYCENVIDVPSAFAQCWVKNTLKASAKYEALKLIPNISLPISLVLRGTKVRGEVKYHDLLHDYLYEYLEKLSDLDETHVAYVARLVQHIRELDLETLLVLLSNHEDTLRQRLGWFEQCYFAAISDEAQPSDASTTADQVPCFEFETVALVYASMKRLAH